MRKLLVVVSLLIVGAKLTSRGERFRPNGLCWHIGEIVVSGGQVYQCMGVLR